MLKNEENRTLVLTGCFSVSHFADFKMDRNRNFRITCVCEYVQHTCTCIHAFIQYMDVYIYWLIYFFTIVMHAWLLHISVTNLRTFQACSVHTLSGNFWMELNVMSIAQLPEDCITVERKSILLWVLFTGRWWHAWNYKRKAPLFLQVNSIQIQFRLRKLNHACSIKLIKVVAYTTVTYIMQYLSAY